MNENMKKELLPEMPETFHRAVTDALDHIQEERQPARPVRRSLILAVALVAMATAALAAHQWNLFDVLDYMTGKNPQHADEVMTSNLHTETVNGVEIAIREAGYDGRTLFLQYSYRMTDVDVPLDQAGEDPWDMLADRNVGWWIDHLWINGQCLDMAADSGSDTRVGDQPGELIQTEYWRLDNIDVALSGKVEIALPIGEKQPLVRRADHPELFDENGNRLLPDKGLVTFTLDTGDALSKLITEQPNIPTVLPEVTAQVSEVCFSPLMTYITLSMEPDAEALAAFIAEHGPGHLNEAGEVMWPYTGMDVYGAWITSLELVDGSGTQLFPGHYGNNGYGSEWAEFLYPYIENIPEELYLAPISQGTADMTRAVRVR